MERLTIKKLAPYLPYGLKVIGFNSYIDKDMVCDLTDRNLWKHIENQSKPLLRPLSSLTEEIEHNGSKFTPIYELGELALKKLPEGFDNLEDATKWVSISVYVGINELMYWLFEWLCEHHFDVFGLIDLGLALPIDGKEVEG